MELRPNKAVHHGKARLGLARTLGRKATAVGNEEDLDDAEAPGRAEREGGCVGCRGGNSLIACGQGSSLLKRAMGARRCVKWGEHTRTLPHKKNPQKRGTEKKGQRRVLKTIGTRKSTKHLAGGKKAEPKNKKQPTAWRGRLYDPARHCGPVGLGPKHTAAQRARQAGMGRLWLCRYPTLDPFLALLDHSERSGCARLGSCGGVPGRVD